MSAGPEPHVSTMNIEETRRQIQRLFEEVARLSELDLSPPDYFGEFLKRVLAALAAPAGAVWLRTPQGNLQLQYQVNLEKLQLGRSEEAQQAHQELLRLAFQQPRPLHLPPQSFAGQPENGQAAPGNPTDFILLLVPIQVENQVDGLLEVWQTPDRNPAAVNGFLQFMNEMCQLASRYLRNRKMREMAGQQALWTQLEAFSRTIHGSLNPVEVAYLIANEGRRLVDCDRMSIGVRYARKCKVEAVSGADVVERRSNLVQLMQRLFDRVIAWGEKLVYSGTKEEALPPDVMKALDEYLTESNSKLLVVLPLKDERDKDTHRKPRSALMMECFEPQATPEQLVARLEVVGKHAAPALYNAVEHRRIPMRFLWVPLAKVQEGLGGKARAIIAAVCAGLLALAAVLYFVPYQLKMDATGKLLPEERLNIYSPAKGYIEDIAIQPGDRVRPRQKLVQLTDLDLAKQFLELEGEIEGARKGRDQLEGLLNTLGNVPPDQQLQLMDQRLKLTEYSAAVISKSKLRDKLHNAYGVTTDEKGAFWLPAPEFPEADKPWFKLTEEALTELPLDGMPAPAVEKLKPLQNKGYLSQDDFLGAIASAVGEEDPKRFPDLRESWQNAWNKYGVSKEDQDRFQSLLLRVARTEPVWTVLTPDFRETLKRRPVDPKDPVLRLGNKAGPWEIEIKIPQKHIGQVLSAFDYLGTDKLDVDLIVRSDPTHTYRGILERGKIANQADPHKDDNNEAEPVVLAWVRVVPEKGDIPDGMRIPDKLMQTSDTEVKAKVRCGRHKMGYSLFYGVWEFFYEKVVFFF